MLCATFILKCIQSTTKLDANKLIAEREFLMKTVSVFGLHKSNMYSKQIKGIALIIVLVLLSMLLCGCVQQSSLRQLNEDATLGPVAAPKTDLRF